MNTNYDVVVVGAGPVGITFASTLQAMNPKCKICVIDDRPLPTRNHGLKIRSDSVAKIHEILEQSLKKYSSSVNGNNISLLKDIFSKWSESFVRTSKIELDIAEIARKFGVTVLRDKQYKVSEENQVEIFETNDGKTELQRIMQTAQIVIGADGSHSVVREIIGSRLVDVKTLQYLVELKYQTDGKAVPRSYSEAFIESAQCGHIDIETMHKSVSEENKPVTLHIFVDKKSYDNLRVMDENGRLKGVFGNSWTLEEIKKIAGENQEIESIYSTFQTHLKGISARGGHCYEEKISTLEMTMYRSEKSVERYKGKFVLLIGDANAGMVIERGFNKGLKEAALCAKAVSDYFKIDQNGQQDMPKPFIEYQQEVKKVFEDEKKWAELKNIGINTAQTSVRMTQSTMETSETSSEFCSTSFKMPTIISDFIGTFSSKPTSNDNQN